MFRVKFHTVDSVSINSLGIFNRYEHADAFLESMMVPGHPIKFTGADIEENIEGIGWCVAQEPDNYESDYCSQCDVYAAPCCMCGQLNIGHRDTYRYALGK